MLYTDEEVQAVAGALVRAIREHGAPNRFSPGELSAGYAGLPEPLVLGQIGSQCNHVLCETVKKAIPEVEGIGYEPALSRRAVSVGGQVTHERIPASFVITGTY